MKTDLRLTDTNAASDSKGRTWGLEGNLFWWLVGGVAVGITVFFVLLVIMKVSLGTSFLAALAPVALCLAYIFGLRQTIPFHAMFAIRVWDKTRRDQRHISESLASKIARATSELIRCRHANQT